nr:transposon protein, putative, CACTA, En/Spm sub-class [Ipomoea batatas]
MSAVTLPPVEKRRNGGSWIAKLLRSLLPTTVVVASVVCDMERSGGGGCDGVRRIFAEYVLGLCDSRNFLTDYDVLFRIEDNDKGCRTQNSGVYVIGDLGTDTNPVEYYGVLTEILELQYLGARRVVLFRCRWFNVHDNEKGARVDGYGFTTINPQRILRTNEPFILANQASQVFYAIDNMVKGWHVVIKTQPRDLYKMPQSEEVENDIVENDNIEDLGEAYQYGESFKFKCTGDPVNFDNQSTWTRTNVEPIEVEVSTLKKNRKRKAT